MPAPTVTGTAVFNNETSGASDDVTITIPADATTVVVAFGGFASGADMATQLSSVQGDPTGTPYNIDDVTLLSQTSSDNQWCGLYAIHDTNVNWPGSGSETFRVTLVGGGRQLKVGAFCLTDVDTSGTPENGTFESLTMSDSSAAPSQSVSSSTNALDIAVCASYSADLSDDGGDNTYIGGDQNGVTSSSLSAWSEAGVSGTNTVEASDSVNYAMCLASFEGTTGGGGSTFKGLTLLGVG